MPRGQLLTYVKEASRTYAMGFFVASVALSRSALEAAVRPRAAKYLGASAAADLDLKDLIDRAQIGDKAMRDFAHRVLIIGNDVIHEGQSVSAEDALHVIEAVRAIIAYLETH